MASIRSFVLEGIGKSRCRQGEKLSLKTYKPICLRGSAFCLYPYAIIFRASAPVALDGVVFSRLLRVVERKKFDEKVCLFFWSFWEDLCKYLGQLGNLIDPLANIPFPKRIVSELQIRTRGELQ